MSTALPRYSALYSISDLHLGGEPGMQMFGHDARLGGFLKWLAGPGPEVQDLALVLNGDVIDSLPGLKEGSYIEVNGAADLLRATKHSFPGVFAGLAQFVATSGRELVVLLGNHDLELALPEAQEAFLECVDARDAARRGRVRFETNGTGFRCAVGQTTVYLTHGNEADRWNHVDHEALRRAAHARSLGQRFDASRWTPNAGTKLVVDAMNDIKRTYPFVDLLKPETDAAIRILAALDVDRVEHVFAALPAFARRAWAQTGPGVVLGQSDRRGDPRTDEVVELFAEARAHLALDADPPRPGAGLLERVRELQRDATRPEALVRDDLADLGIVGYWVDRWRGRTLEESLRRALQDWLAKDRSFRLTDVDSVCRGVTSQLGSGIDVVITGHTHLPRWLEPPDRPNLAYLNAGTWARLIGFDEILLADENAIEFERLFQVLRSDSMADLDAHEIRLHSGEKRKLVLDATVAARVVPTANGGTRAELVRVRGAGDVVETIDRAQDMRRWP